jgi:hypothetical protein
MGSKKVMMHHTVCFFRRFSRKFRKKSQFLCNEMLIIVRFGGIMYVKITKKQVGGIGEWKKKL